MQLFLYFKFILWVILFKVEYSLNLMYILFVFKKIGVKKYDLPINSEKICGKIEDVFKRNYTTEKTSLMEAVTHQDNTDVDIV